MHCWVDSIDRDYLLQQWFRVNKNVLVRYLYTFHVEVGKIRENIVNVLRLYF